MKLFYWISFSFMLVIAAKVKAQTSTTLLDSHKHQQAIQLNLGSQGIGAEFRYGLSPSFNLRPGVNFIPFKANDIFKISGFNSTSHVSADFYNVHVWANYVPIKSAAWFQLVGGLGYFFEANGKVRITPSDDYTYGDLVLTEDQIGYVDLNVDWQGLAPYLGLGFANTFPKKRFNVGVDLGIYYLNKPKATIIGTGILEGNSSQTSQFQSNISDYRWLPILQIGFNYKL